MKHREFKVITAIAAFVISLLLLMGIYHLYMNFVIKKPLQESLLSREEINGVEIERKKGIYNIEVNLDRVDNLQREYQEISGIVESRIKGNYKIAITASENSRLQDAYTEIQPAIYEALSNNTYLSLRETVEKHAEQGGIEGKMYVDEKFLYIHLSDNEDNLYIILQRQTKEEIT